MTTVTVDDSEVRAMLTRIDAILEPRHMAISVTELLKVKFREQVDASFQKEGVVDGGAWAPLSDWRVNDRGGSDRPILNWTGDFVDEVARYKGDIGLVAGEAFIYDFPGRREASGRYFGLTAGQRVNPLGATPLAATPRPLLGSGIRQNRDTVESLVEYFTSEGLPIEVVT